MMKSLYLAIVVFTALGNLQSSESEYPDRSGPSAKDQIRVWVDSRLPGLIDALESVERQNNDAWIGKNSDAVQIHLLNLKEEFDSNERNLCVWIDRSIVGRSMLMASLRQSFEHDTGVAFLNLYFLLDSTDVVVRSTASWGTIYNWTIEDARKCETLEGIEPVE